ncbi:hypothetical protein CR513_44152, partial [Mucuna pruriens]
MIPVEVEESSPQAILCQSDNNEEELRVNLDLLQEEREMDHICECATKARVAKRYNSTIFPCPIRKDDMVLRKTLIGVATNNLTPNWEGPFRVQEEVGQEAFQVGTSRWKHGASNVEFGNLEETLQLNIPRIVTAHPDSLLLATGRYLDNGPTSTRSIGCHTEAPWRHWGMKVESVLDAVIDPDGWDLASGVDFIRSGRSQPGEDSSDQDDFI